MGAPPPQPTVSLQDPICAVWSLLRVGLLHPPLFVLLCMGGEQDPHGYVKTRSVAVSWMQEPSFRVGHGHRLSAKLRAAGLFRKIRQMQ